MAIPPFVIGYLVGTIPFALLLAGHVAGTDVRLAGTGNVGAANLFRSTRPSLVPPLTYLTEAPGPVTVGALVAVTLIVYRHRPNLARLRAGTEWRLRQRR